MAEFDIILTLRDQTLAASLSSTSISASVNLAGPRGPQGIPGDPATNLVTSVNGKQGAVVLDATDVGADVSGSAAQALQDAKDYTDAEIAAIDFPVDSVNGQTNAVILNTDDISDTATNRYTSDTDITRLASTSGTNTGDQDLAPYELLSNKSTTTTLGTSDTLYPTQNAVKAYVDAQDALKANATDLANYVLKAGDTDLGTMLPDASKNLGGTSNYWANLYSSRVNLNSTAYIDGATAGQVESTGRLYVNYPVALSGSSETSYALRVRNINGISLTLGTDVAGGYIQSFASMPLRLNGVGNNVTFGSNQGSSTLVGFQTNSPTHTVTLASSATGIALYNTVDQTTNYERYRQYWTGNVLTMANEYAGTGAARSIQLRAGNGASSFTVGISGQSSYGEAQPTGAVLSSGGFLYGTSGITNGLRIIPTISQSATAGYTALLINPTETTTGSGPKNLLDAQVGGVSKFKVANTGTLTIADGTQGASKVLTSDASGNASWQTPSSGSGITRSITVTSGNITAGATALTDYIYIISGAHTVTLPTAVGNTNRYTLKNSHTIPVAIAFTGAETADGGSITLGVNESVELISNNIEWKII